MKGVLTGIQQKIEDDVRFNLRFIGDDIVSGQNFLLKEAIRVNYHYAIGQILSNPKVLECLSPDLVYTAVKEKNDEVAIGLLTHDACLKGLDRKKLSPDVLKWLETKELKEQREREEIAREKEQALKQQVEEAKLSAVNTGTTAEIANVSVEQLVSSTTEPVSLMSELVSSQPLKELVSLMEPSPPVPELKSEVVQISPPVPIVLEPQTVHTENNNCVNSSTNTTVENTPGDNSVNSSVLPPPVLPDSKSDTQNL
jgi:hypothetical protein